MARPFSSDLRERVVLAVERDGLSCRQAAARFGVGVSTVIAWVSHYRRTGSLAPGKMGGNRPKKIAGTHRDWLLQRCRERDFTLRGLVAELGERGLAVDYRSVWAFVHAEGLSYKKRRWSPPNGAVQTLRAVARSGSPVRA
jgi:putative transposase